MRPFLYFLTCCLIPLRYEAQPVKLKSSYEAVNYDLKAFISRGNPGEYKPAMNTPTVIGLSDYDLQSNGSGYNNVLLHSNNISVVWNKNDASGPDANIGNAYSNDTAWIPQVDTSGLSFTKWPNIGNDPSGNELIFLRNTLNSQMQILSRVAGGMGGWTIANGPPSAYASNWPRMSIAGPNGTTMHCLTQSNTGIPVNGVIDIPLYHRSNNLGLTWSALDNFLPGMDSTLYYQVAAESYALDASGSIVAILHGGITNDLALWKSTDNGNTWIKTVIRAFPIPAYNDLNNISDTNGDGVADTISTSDGSLEVLIDDNGMVHCWSGYIKILDDDTTSPLGYFAESDGLYYWNESFGIAPPLPFAFCQDLNGDGSIDVIDVPPYNGTSMTSMPTAAMDSSGTIFVAYSSVVENTSNGGIPDYCYRNVYMMYSPDHGLTWTYPANISNSDFDEAVFPSLARDANGFAHLVYHQDGSPGLAVYGEHPQGVSEVIYHKVSTFDIAPVFNGPYTANFVISGQTYNDVNGNGLHEPGTDTVLFNQNIRILPLNIIVSSHNNGNYVAQLPAGNYQVECIIPPGWVQTSSPVSYSVNLTGPPVTGIDFGLQASGTLDSVSVSLSSGLPRCNSDVTFIVSATNLSNQNRDMDVFFTPDVDNTFLNSNPNPSGFNGSTYEWNFSQVLPYETKYIMNSMLLPTAGTAIDDSVSAELYDNGMLLKTEYDALSQQVVCAFDPNVKVAFPGGVGPLHLTAFNIPLNYTIHMQNTGNDTAFRVIIKDVIDEDLDLSTLNITGASHPFTWRLINRELEITFDNIQLPDSNVNEPASHGFVAYRIYPLQGLPEMTPIENTANIFFDYNNAVITNSTLNTLSSTVGLEEISSSIPAFSVYPNPSNGWVHCFFPLITDPCELLVTDTNGKLVKHVPDAVNGQIIDMGKLSNGIYFITLRNNLTGWMDVEKSIIFHEK